MIAKVDSTTHANSSVLLNMIPKFQTFDVCAPFNNIVAQKHASNISIMKWSDNETMRLEIIKFK